MTPSEFQDQQANVLANQRRQYRDRATLVFAKTEAWEYRLDLVKLDRPHGHHSLTISSRWPGAKNPDELVTQFQATLDRTDLRAIRDHIDNQLGERK